MFALLAGLVMGMTFAACGGKKDKDKDDEDKKDKDKTEVKADADAEDEDDGDFEAFEEAASADSFGEASGSPAEQYVAITKEFIQVIKNTHINSAADAEALKAIGEKYQAKMETLQKDLENMSQEEQMKVAGEMLSIVGELQDLEKEVKRLEQEAASVGVNLDDLNLD